MAGGVDLVVLGSGQDGGAPQLGHDEDPGWTNPSLRRTAACIGLVDRATGRRWLIEATPDLRDQLHRFSAIAPPTGSPGPALAGLLLTHAHIGHYTGLMFFGQEAAGAQGLPVWVMPRMAAFLAGNGPWSQLLALGNIQLHALAHGQPVQLAPALRVTPLLVPHRQEFSEVVAFRIEGPHRRVLFLPDIDRWEDWDAAGVRVEDHVRAVDVAYLDGTFFSGDELPGRDMSQIPHPTISSSLERFAALHAQERAKVRFIHLNWSNPARYPDSDAALKIGRAGMAVAGEMEQLSL